MINDLPANTSVGALTFIDDYSLSGNALTLTGNITCGGHLGISVDLKIVNSLEIAATGVGSVGISGAVDVEAQTLTIKGVHFNGPINGSGMIVINAVLPDSTISGGTFDGLIKGGAQGGNATFSGDLPNATVSIEMLRLPPLKGVTLGDVTIPHWTPTVSGVGGVFLGGNVLHTKAFAMQGALMQIGHSSRGKWSGSGYRHSDTERRAGNQCDWRTADRTALYDHRQRWQ